MAIYRRFLWKTWFSVFSLVLCAILVFSSVAVVGATDGTENWAFVELRHFYQYTTSDDYISNTPQSFSPWWGVYFLNWADETHEPIVNPNVTLISDSAFSQFRAHLPWGYHDLLAPNVTDPPKYMWFWERNLLEGTEPAHSLTVWAFEAGSSVFAPGLSLERKVSPSIIQSPVAVQRIDIRLTIEQPFPESVNSVSVGIGAWWSEHVFTEFLAASPRESVVYGQQEVQWHIPAGQLEVGKTYKLKALFRVYKRVEEAVLYKPNVGVTVSYRTPQEALGNSVTLHHPDGATAIVSGENEVRWVIIVTGGYSLTMSKVSKILPV